MNKIFQNIETINDDILNSYKELNEQYSKSGDYDYAEVRFFIIGEDVFKKAIEGFPMLDVVKTDTWSGTTKKMDNLIAKSRITEGEFVNCYEIRLYNSHGTVDVSNDCYIRRIIRIGKLGSPIFIQPYFEGAPSKMGARFFLFNDDREYRSYLPYNYEKDHPEPNSSSALTDKKLMDWVCYLTHKANSADREKERRENSVEAFYNRLRESIDENMCDRFEINENGATIVANNLRLTVKVHSDNTYTTNIDFDKRYNSTPFDMFIRMTGTGKKQNG